MAAENVLDVFAMIDPTKIIEKLKLHLLAHLHADIIWFGPLIGVAMKAFECFNAIFRFCSIYLSRNISKQLVGQESLEHRVTGGWRHSTRTSDNWV